MTHNIFNFGTPWNADGDIVFIRFSLIVLKTITKLFDFVHISSVNQNKSIRKIFTAPQARPACVSLKVKQGLR